MDWLYTFFLNPSFFVNYSFKVYRFFILDIYLLDLTLDAMKLVFCLFDSSIKRKFFFFYVMIFIPTVVGIFNLYCQILPRLIRLHQNPDWSSFMLFLLIILFYQFRVFWRLAYNNINVKKYIFLKIPWKIQIFTYENKFFLNLQILQNVIKYNKTDSLSKITSFLCKIHRYLPITDLRL